MKFNNVHYLGTKYKIGAVVKYNYERAGSSAGMGGGLKSGMIIRIINNHYIEVKWDDYKFPSIYIPIELDVV